MKDKGKRGGGEKERERESFLAKNRSSREPFQKHVCLSSRNSSFLRSCKREKGRCGQVNDPLSRGWRGLATAETGWPSIAMQEGKKSKRRNPSQRGAANREHLPVYANAPAFHERTLSDT